MLGHPGLYNLICPVCVLEVCISAWSMARSGLLLETLSIGLKPAHPQARGSCPMGKYSKFPDSAGHSSVGLKQGPSQVNNPRTDKGHTRESP